MHKPDDFTMPIQSVDYKLYDYASGRKEFLLNSCILNESCTTKLYRRSLLDRAKVNNILAAAAVIFAADIILSILFRTPITY